MPALIIMSVLRVGGVHPNVFAKLDLGIAVDQQTRAQTSKFGRQNFLKTSIKNTLPTIRVFSILKRF